MARPEEPATTVRDGKRRRLASSSLFLMAGLLISGMLMTFARVVAGRSMGPAGLGVMSALWAFAATFGAIPLSGIGPTITRFAALYTASGERAALSGLLRSTATLSVGLATALCAGCVAGAPWIATRWFHEPIEASLVKITGIGVAAWAVLMWCSAVFRGRGSTAGTVIHRDLLRPILLVALLAWWGADGTLTLADSVWAGSLSVMLPALTASAHAFVACRPDLEVTTAVTKTAEWFHFGLPLTFSMLLQQVAGRSLDVIVLAAMLPADDVGIYASATVLAQLPGLLIQGVNYLSLPLLSEGVVAEREENLTHARALTTGLGLPAIAAVSMWPSLAGRTLFGPGFEGAWPVLVLLAVGLIPSVLLGPLGQLLMAVSKTRSHLVADVVSVVVFLALALILSPLIGIAGAAIARSISQVSFETVSFVALRPVMRIRLVEWSMIRTAIPSLMVLALAKLMTTITSAVGPPSLRSDIVQIGVVMLFGAIALALAVRNVGLWPGSSRSANP